MRTLKSKLFVSILAAIISFPIIIIIVNYLWKVGLFNFNTGLYEMPFKELLTHTLGHTFDIAAIMLLIVYFYFAWYQRIKDNGIKIISNIVNREKKILVFCYLAVLLVIILGGLFSIISEFTALFTPISHKYVVF